MTAVGGLLFVGCPPTIAGLIVAIVIYAINRKAGGAFAHIGQKVRKCFPFFAHCNSSCFIVSRLCVIWVEAPRLHIFPNTVGSGARLAVFEVHGSIENTV